MIVASAGATVRQDSVVNLTGESCERVVSICRALARCGAYVLHGSNVRPALHRLEPRQANDASKFSGNYRAVYGSTSVDAVLMHAILDRGYLASRFDSYTVGYRSDAGRLWFRATRNLYDLFRQQDPGLCSDGYVYVLPRRCFVCCPENSTEFFAFEALKPLLTLAVPSSLSTYLFRAEGGSNDTIVPYTADDEVSLTVPT